MLLATLLALGAAVLHASWNLVAKRASGDRYVVLWAQFVAAGLLSLPLMVVHQVVWGMPVQGYLWAAASGAVHLPYVWLLARAYSQGDFSVAYPVARGGGAALAAVCGVLLLGDRLSALEVVGIAVVVCGLLVLARGTRLSGLTMAMSVALTIGAYTTIDAKGARVTDSVAYVFATFVGVALSNTVFGVCTGRWRHLTAMLRENGRRAFATGTASLVTYGMVLVAVQRAPVGYVTALRESSVVLAALAGWRLRGEGDHRRRVAAALVVFAGLVTLVVGH